MDAALTKTCPRCGHTDPDCLACSGVGLVADHLEACPSCDNADDDAPCQTCGGRRLVWSGLVEDCPACEGASGRYRGGEWLTCRHCHESGRMMSVDAQALRDAMADEAEADRMERRGLHVSGVPFGGPF